MKTWLFILSSLCIGAGIEISIVGDSWQHMPAAFNAGRLLGGTLGFGLITWVVVAGASGLVERMQKG
jgi:hypothetical protein